MLEMVKREAFDVVVFWKLDRFSRSLMHAVQLESDLREHDVYLYSVTEQIDTTSATGRFNFRNIASAAEFERDMIRQRTQMGLNELASECKWPNDSPPLGYAIASDGRLEIIEDERRVVTDIFEMYIEKRSMPDVAEALDDQGVQTKDGQKWTPRGVGDILRNSIYIGQYEVGDVSKHVDDYQIVENDVFDRVSEIRHRFQEGNGSRKQMPESRKERIVQNVREKYQEYLDRHN
jgi:site-specific DNA recombinase